MKGNPKSKKSKIQNSVISPKVLARADRVIRRARDRNSAFPIETNNAFAKADGELELSEKVESEKAIDAALRW
jgi:hypothetical protein